jgi:DNA adenine methylase
MSTSAKLPPVLRYHGGKHRAFRMITDLFPPHSAYYELYGGAGSILMNKPRVNSELYNDLDGDTHNYFRVLQDPHTSAQLAELLTVTPYSRREFDEAFELCEESVERARRTVIRAMMGCGSRGATSIHKTGYRWRDRRDGWARSEHLWVKYPAAIAAFTERLRGVVLENKPAIDVLTKVLHEPGALIYCDPPYVLSSCADRSESRSYRHTMTDEQHIELAKTLHQATAMVVVSGYQCELYDFLYDGWPRVDFENRTQHSGVKMESVWLNPQCAESQRQGQMFDDERR